MNKKKKYTIEEFYIVDKTKNDDEDKSAHTIIDNSRRRYQNALKSEGFSIEQKNDYKDKHVSDLINYGFDYKSNENDYRTAKMLFSNALMLNPELAIAYYRLGHILFKQEKYGEAIFNFEKAMKIMEEGKLNKDEYKLDKPQIENAKVLMAYCALQIIKNIKGESLETETYYNYLDELYDEFYSKYDSHINGNYIKMKLIGEDDSTLISYDDYCNKLEENSIIMLDGYETYSLNFNKRSIQFRDSVNYKLLKDLLEGQLADKNEYISSKSDHNGNTNNSFNQKIRRLRIQIKSLGLDEDIFAIINERNSKVKVETQIPIIIFSRIED